MFAAAAGAEAIIISTLAFAGLHVAEVLEIPVISTSLQPIVATRVFPYSISPILPEWVPFKGAYNRLSYRSTRIFLRLNFKPTNKSHFFRLVTKHVFGAKLRRSFKSIPDLRNIMEQASKYQYIPPGTEIWPILVNGVPAEWVRAPAAQTNKVILYLHGGALVAGSPATHRELAVRLSAATQAKLLVLDHRLAPEHPFPAALQDAISAYHV